MKAADYQVAFPMITRNEVIGLFTCLRVKLPKDLWLSMSGNWLRL